MALNCSTILVEERNKERKSINPHSKKWSGLHLKQESLPTIPKSSLGKNCLLLSGHQGVHTRTKMEGKGKAVFVDRVCCIRVGDFWSLLCCSHVLTQCLWVNRTSVCVGGRGSFIDSASWVLSTYVEILEWTEFEWRVPKLKHKQGKEEKIRTGKKPQLTKGTENESRGQLIEDSWRGWFSTPTKSQDGNSRKAIKWEKKERWKKKVEEDPGSEPEERFYPSWVIDVAEPHY